MANEVASAFVSLVPSFRGGRGAIEGEAKSMGRRFASGFGKAAAIGIAGLLAGAVAGGTKAFKTFADFDQLIRQVGVQTGLAGNKLKEMSDLALQLGKDTSFSASEAAEAMLELAKGGLTAAQIKAGALQQTLTLAAAGGIRLGDAATYIVSAMGAFGLRAQDAARIAAALAGGANASTASVESLGMALQQVGPGAKQAGLSLNETVAALAAFENAGVKGSDAGTSLKVMLQRLVPQTTAAKDAMKELGLNFVNADGSFKSLAEIAGILQDRLGGLSAAQRTVALNTIFGSDASRAAAILMETGEKGIRKYIRATEDLAAAEELAATMTSGASGSIEQMMGSLETLAIVVGQTIAPAVTAGANALADLFGALASGVQVVGPRVQAWFENTFGGWGARFAELRQLAASFINGFRGGNFGGSGPFVEMAEAGARFRESLERLQPYVQKIGSALSGAFKQIIPALGQFGAALGTQVASLLPGLLRIFAKLRPVIAAVGAVFAQVAPAASRLATTLGGFIRSLLPTVERFAGEIAAHLAPALKEIGRTIATEIIPRLQAFLQAIQPVAKFLLEVVGGAVVAALKGAIQAVRGAMQMFGGLLDILTGILTGDWRKAWEGLKDFVAGIWNAIVGIVKVALQLGIGKAFSLGAKVLSKLGGKIWSGIQKVFSSGVQKVEKTVLIWLYALILRFHQTPGRILNAIKSLPGRLIAFFENLAKNSNNRVVRGIATIVSNYLKMPSRILSAVRSLLSSLANFFRNVMSRALSAIRSGASNAVKFVRTIPSRIKGALGNLPRLLYNSGRQIIQGLINGIKAMAGRVRAAVNSVMSAARRLLPFSPAKEGPFSGRGWTLYSGMSIGEALAEGIERSRAEVREAARELADAANPGAVRLTGAAPVGASGGLHINELRVEVAADDIEQMKSVTEFFQRIEQEARRMRPGLGRI